MKVEILDETTKYPLQKIGKMAGICWGADVTDIDKNIKRAKRCIHDGHGRVLELVDIELCISEVSARVIREWYTHIGGSPTRLQESTRYINESNFKEIEPNSVKSNDRANTIWQCCMGTIENAYKDLSNLDIPREDVAMVLPLSMETKIIDKRNLRNLIEMSNLRLCTRAYWEYRELMKEIRKELSKLSKEWKWICDNFLKPKCDICGYCTESKSCGRKPKKEELVEGLKKVDVLKLAEKLEQLKYNTWEDSTSEELALIVEGLQKLGGLE